MLYVVFFMYFHSLTLCHWYFFLRFASILRYVFLFLPIFHSLQCALCVFVVPWAISFFHHSFFFSVVFPVFVSCYHVRLSHFVADTFFFLFAACFCTRFFFILRILSTRFVFIFYLVRWFFFPRRVRVCRHNGSMQPAHTHTSFQPYCDCDAVRKSKEEIFEHKMRMRKALFCHSNLFYGSNVIQNHSWPFGFSFSFRFLEQCACVKSRNLHFEISQRNYCRWKHVMF